MDASALALVLGSSVVIGLLLGVLGAGGSILAVPLLVYVAGLAPTDAIGTSLAIVGATSAVAAIAHHRRGHVRMRVALLFGGSGIATAFLAGRLTHLVPGHVLMLAFAVLMLVAGGSMLLRRRSAPVSDGPSRPRVVIVVAAGAAVGAVTGFLGIGGGFLAVPALIALCRLDVRDAVGTSLAVIAVNAAAGLAGHLGGDHGLDLGLVAAATVFAVVGALLGERVGRSLSLLTLRRGLAVLVIGIGAVVGLSAGLAATS